MEPNTKESREVKENDKEENRKKLISRSKFLETAGLIIAGSGGIVAAGGAVMNWKDRRSRGVERKAQMSNSHQGLLGSVATANSSKVKPVRITADPAKLPPPIHRSFPITNKVFLETKEMIGEIKEGVLFDYMTFNGQVPAPLIRVREGDTIDLTISGNKNNKNAHSVDFHSCYATGGSADYTTVQPGESKRVRFKVMNPGAFIYHCGVPNLDYHISSGMFGLILVEPEEGLPPVDREFYFGQNEIYVKDPVNANTPASFDFDNLLKEEPTYVVLNGAFNAITDERYGSLKAKEGETIRLYFVNGGPNLISSFHPIGNVWSKFWLQGSLANKPFELLQTVQVNPGSCAILEMQLPVPEIIRLADHSITRTVRQGLLAEIKVLGKPEPDIFESLPS